jgi:hypothetical protein
LREEDERREVFCHLATLEVLGLIHLRGLYIIALVSLRRLRVRLIRRLTENWPPLPGFPLLYTFVRVVLA